MLVQSIEASAIIFQCGSEIIFQCKTSASPICFSFDINASVSTETDMLALPLANLHSVDDAGDTDGSLHLIIR